MKLIPKLIRPYFKLIRQSEDADNSLVEGKLTCCTVHDFEIFIVGNIKRCLFSKRFLYSENDEIVLEARCKRCDKIIPVFNSSIEGYRNLGVTKKNICATPRHIDCEKCRNDSFSVTIKYEYPNIQELQEIEISDLDKAFTWIWITLECSKCGKKYKNFVDFETT